RLLLAHPRLRPSGGGNLVGAWALEALAPDYEVSVATLEPVSCEALNLHFGTHLDPSQFSIHLAPKSYDSFIRSMPTPAALMDICLTMRWAQELDREHPYDVLFSTHNEMDFHRRGIQYVHYPWQHMPRPEHEMRWYHNIPTFL